MNPEAKILSGIAGEYFVAGELSRRGYIASITLKNTAKIDVLASDGERAVNIQVKTRSIERADGWDLGNEPLRYEGFENNFYVLVESFADSNNKDIGYYIIPTDELNKITEENFQIWKNGKNKRTGEPRKSERRFFRIKEHPDLNIEKYRDNWDILFN